MSTDRGQKSEPSATVNASPGNVIDCSRTVCSRGKKSTQKSIGETLEEAVSKKPPLAANAPGIEKLSSEQTNGTLLRERDARRTKSEVRTRIAKQQKYRRTTPGRRKGITTRKQLLFDGRRCGRPGQISAREDR